MKLTAGIVLVLCTACQHHTPAVRAGDSAVVPAAPPGPSQDASGAGGTALPAHGDSATVTLDNGTNGGTNGGADGGAGGALSVLADQIATEVSSLRGLSILRPIQRGVMSRGAIVARMRDRVRAEYPAGEVELEGELYKRLGLLPQSMDYERTMFDLLEEQVAGFYDPDTRRLYISDWLPPAAQPITMAHEITHALQDQHFDIARYTHHVRGRGDAQTAAMSVVEGDATVAMLDYQGSQLGRRVFDLPPQAVDMLRNAMGSAGTGSEQPRLAAAPRALRETLLFPYLAGFAMCFRAVQSVHGYAPVDTLLAHPPESTEQVIHEDKLASREPPVIVAATVPRPLAEGWDLAYDDTLGELGTRLALADAMPDARANAAAAGWGGDRAVLLVPHGGASTGSDGGTTVSRDALAQDIALWTVVMDPAPAPTPDAEAVDFASAAALVLARRLPEGATVNIPGALTARVSGTGRVSLVARAGRTVLVADRLPMEQAAAVVRAVLSPRR